MLIKIILVIVGLALIYLSISNIGKWKAVNEFFAFLGGGFLLFGVAISIVLPPVVEFIEKIAHVS